MKTWITVELCLINRTILEYPAVVLTQDVVNMQRKSAEAGGAS